MSKSSYVGQGKKLKVTNEVRVPCRWTSPVRAYVDTNRHRSTPRSLEDWLLRLATGRSTWLSLPRLPR